MGFFLFFLMLSSAVFAETSQLEEILKMRDPFKRPDFQQGKELGRTDLERFSLDSYRLIGILTGPKRLKAMLQDPEGKTHFVSEKTKIGNRSGLVRRITPDSVLVREKMTDLVGQEEYVDSEIRLPPEGKLIKSGGK
jgi:Tfp pilus assembly protein PilP